MDLKGNFSETIIKNNETIDFKDSMDVYFENIGAAPVQIGIRTLTAGKSFRIHSSVPFNDNATLVIEFENTESKKALYFSKTRIIKTKCNCKK